MYSFSQAKLQKNTIDKKYEFASIQYLIEQEVGRLVLTQIYKNLGIEISITPLPAHRAQHTVRTGHKSGEIMRIWSYGEVNKTTIRVPTPYYVAQTMPFILKGKSINISNKEELKPYRVAKVRGVKHTDHITAGLDNVYETNSTKNMFKLLMTGKVDVALTSTLDGNTVIAREGFDSITALANPLATLPVYHYIHESEKHLVSIVDKEIIRLQKNGELAKMIDRAERQLIDRPEL